MGGQGLLSFLVGAGDGFSPTLMSRPACIPPDELVIVWLIEDASLFLEAVSRDFTVLTEVFASVFGDNAACGADGCDGNACGDICGSVVVGFVCLMGSVCPANRNNSTVPQPIKPKASIETSARTEPLSIFMSHIIDAPDALNAPNRKSTLAAPIRFGLGTCSTPKPPM